MPSEVNAGVYNVFDKTYWDAVNSRMCSRSLEFYSEAGRTFKISIRSGLRSGGTYREPRPLWPPSFFKGQIGSAVFPLARHCKPR